MFMTEKQAVLEAKGTIQNSIREVDYDGKNTGY